MPFSYIPVPSSLSLSLHHHDAIHSRTIKPSFIAFLLFVWIECEKFCFTHPQNLFSLLSLFFLHTKQLKPSLFIWNGEEQFHNFREILIWRRVVSEWVELEREKEEEEIMEIIMNFTSTPFYDSLPLYPKFPWEDEKSWFNVHILSPHGA